MRSLFVAPYACLLAMACATTEATTIGQSSPSEPVHERDVVCSSADGSAGVQRVLVRGVSERTPCALIRSIAGRAEDARTVEQDIEALFASRAYADVVVVREVDEGRTALVFELGLRPLISAVSFEGLVGDAAKVAAQEVELNTPKALDPAWVKASEQRLTEALRDAGYPRATVQAAIPHSSGAAETAVRFVVDEGPRALLSRLAFEGLRVADEKAIRKELRLEVGAPAPQYLIERGQVVVEVTLYDFGLLASSVTTQTAVSDDGTRVEVTFRVKEGRVHKLKKFEIRGDGQLEARVYAPMLKKLKPGAVFSRTTVSEAESALEQLHEEANKSANVEPKVEVLPGTTDVSLTFEVTPR